MKCGLHKIEGESFLKTMVIVSMLRTLPLPNFYHSGSAAVAVLIKGLK